MPNGSPIKQNSHLPLQNKPTTEAVINTIKVLPAMDADIPTSVVSVEGQIMLSTDVGIRKEASRKTQIHQVLTNQHRGVHNKPAQTQNSLPTPVNWARFSKWLEGYLQEKIDFLISGYQEGFKLGSEGTHCQQTSPNLKSAFDHADFVTNKISEELTKGRIGGPFETMPFSCFKLSPLGVVPKKNPGEFRMIHHLSYPRNSGQSVNENIAEEFISVSYAGIQDAISQIKALGKNCFMAKTDVRSAFRIMPIHPNDYHLLGFSWKGFYYYDKCVPFGASSSCRLFEATSTALEWIAIHKLGCAAVVHILDDFLLINSTEEDCTRDLNAFLFMCSDIGIPMALDKTFPASTSMTFVGISLCTIRLEASLPLDKLNKCKQLLHSFATRHSCTLRELQSLIGYLNFCCSIITCGKAFLRRLINLTIGIQKHFHHIRLNSEAKADIALWISFLDRYNGKSMFLSERFLSSNTLSLYTDSAQSLGYGGIYGSRWFYGMFPTPWQSFNITLLDLYPIVLAVNIWGPLWKNHCILFFTDNEALTAIINKQSSTDNNIMKLLRCLVLACLQYKVLFQAKHIQGRKKDWPMLYRDRE